MKNSCNGWRAANPGLARGLASPAPAYHPPPACVRTRTAPAEGSASAAQGLAPAAEPNRVGRKTRHGIKFPIVIAVNKNWDRAYRVGGVSRTIYYAQQNNRIVWTSTSGLSDTASTALASRVKKDLAS
jgi:hypothetical protein